MSKDMLTTSSDEIVITVCRRCGLYSEVYYCHEEEEIICLSCLSKSWSGLQ